MSKWNFKTNILPHEGVVVVNIVHYGRRETSLETIIIKPRAEGFIYIMPVGQDRLVDLFRVVKSFEEKSMIKSESIGRESNTKWRGESIHT